MKYIIFFSLICLTSCYSSESLEQNVFERVQSHLVIGDYFAAKEEAEKFLTDHPNSNKILKEYIRAIAALKDDQKALKVLDSFRDSFPDDSIRDLVEDIGWCILKKGVLSNQYSLRLAALIGAYLTKDAKALPLIIAGLEDSHCLIRSIAVQLSCDFSDQPLKRKILNLFEKEKIWLVRLELIKAIGKMRLKEKKEGLTNILEDERSTYDEKQAAIQSLISLHDDFSLQDIKKLTLSPKAYIRCLACDIAIHFQKKDAKDAILPLLRDTRSDVKISAIKALGFLFASDFSKKQVLEILGNTIEDPDPLVSISASWVLLLKNHEMGIKSIEKWIFSDNKRHQIYASAALASSGSKSIEHMKKLMNKTNNSFVKANLAISLMGFNQNVKKSCNVLFDFLKNTKEYLMLGQSSSLPFQVLEPSRIRHIDQIPNYPQAVDQMTKLSLLSLLAIKEDNRAKFAIQSYLSEKKWGITGVAAATLLKEGDEDCLKIIRDLLNDDNPKIRLQASLVLALYGKDEGAVPHLEKSYDEVDHSTKLYILEALGHIGNEKTFPFLLNVLKEPFMMRRVIAASAILQSLYH